MDIFITLITEMVTRLCAYAQTYVQAFFVYKLCLSKAEITISLRPLHNALKVPDRGNSHSFQQLWGMPLCEGTII